MRWYSSLPFNLIIYLDLGNLGVQNISQGIHFSTNALMFGLIYSCISWNITLQCVVAILLIFTNASKQTNIGNCLLYFVRFAMSIMSVQSCTHQTLVPPCIIFRINSCIIFVFGILLNLSTKQFHLSSSCVFLGVCK